MLEHYQQGPLRPAGDAGSGSAPGGRLRVPQNGGRPAADLHEVSGSHRGEPQEGGVAGEHPGQGRRLPLEQAPRRLHHRGDPALHRGQSGPRLLHPGRQHPVRPGRRLPDHPHVEGAGRDHQRLPEDREPGGPDHRAQVAIVLPCLTIPLSHSACVRRAVPAPLRQGSLYGKDDYECLFTPTTPPPPAYPRPRWRPCCPT